MLKCHCRAGVECQRMRHACICHNTELWYMSHLTDCCLHTIFSSGFWLKPLLLIWCFQMEHEVNPCLALFIKLSTGLFFLSVFDMDVRKQAAVGYLTNNTLRLTEYYKELHLSSFSPDPLILHLLSTYVWKISNILYVWYIWYIFIVFHCDTEEVYCISVLPSREGAYLLILQCKSH